VPVNAEGADSAVATCVDGDGHRQRSEQAGIVGLTGAVSANM
jgi:hypothetical protein